jgi:ankyrin repeat protein
MTHPEDDLKQSIQAGLSRLGPKLAGRYELGWVGPLAAAEAIYPYLSPVVKDARSRVPDLAPLWLFRPRYGEERRPLIATPMWDHPGGALACRLAVHEPLPPEEVTELNECALLLWYAVRRGWLPSPREEEAFRRELSAWAGPELTSPVRGVSIATHLLYAAIKAGDLVALTEMVEADPAILHRPHPSGTTPILYALYCGQRDLVEMLEKWGAPLGVAELTALGRTEELTAKLGEEPGLVHAYSPDGFTLLGLATVFGHEALVELLLGKGADPNLPARNALKVRPLHSAATVKESALSQRLIKRLLAAGAQPNVQQQGGWTPLHAAAVHGRMDGVALLLEHGADPALVADDGTTAQALAARAGHTEVASRLAAK